MISEKRFPIIEAKGSFYDLGYSHGSACKELIEKSLACLDRTTSFSPQNEREEIADGCLPYAEAFAPELLEEVHGIADGSGIDFKRIFYLNCYSELWYASSMQATKEESTGCTTFGLTPLATEDKQTYLVWNCDFYNWWEDTVVFLRITPPGVAPLLMFTYAGLVGANAGINRSFALVVNGIGSKGRTYGVPYSFICRKVVQQRTIGDAVEAILRAEKSVGSSKNFMLANADSDLYSIETSPDDYEVIFPVDGYIGHTNHYVTLKMKLKEEGQTKIKGRSQSIIRWKRINTLIKQNLGQIDFEKIKSFVEDHYNFPASICRHIDLEGLASSGLYLSAPPPRSKTIASVIFNVTKPQAFITRGNPCENSAVEYMIM